MFLQLTSTFMNKFRFNIKNSLLYYKFWKGYKANNIEHPEILNHLERLYGKPVLIDHFHHLDNWQLKDKGEWGSAAPNNLCVFVKENVSVITKQGSNVLVIKTTAEQATGKDWSGKELTRPFSSGLVTSKFTVRPGQVVSATVNTSSSYPGSWFAFWLFRKDIPGDDRYREVDIFEKFMVRDDQKKYSVTVHGGNKQSKEMMSFPFPMFFVNEERMTFTCEILKNGVKIFLNGLLFCQADEPDLEGEYYVIFNDGPSTHGGKVTEKEITNSLPREMELMDFRVYNL